MITNLADALASSINKKELLDQLGWDPKPANQKLVRFEPLKDEDSYLIQTADIVSNFFLNLIRSIVGDNSKTTQLKAKELLKLGVFTDILDEIKKNFKLQNGKCVCINDELKVRLHMTSDFIKSDEIIYR
jgi:hypothetical protein